MASPGPSSGNVAVVLAFNDAVGLSGPFGAQIGYRTLQEVPDHAQIWAGLCRHRGQRLRLLQRDVRRVDVGLNPRARAGHLATAPVGLFGALAAQDDRRLVGRISTENRV